MGTTENGREVRAPSSTLHFYPKRIILAKGSAKTLERRAMVKAICSFYPEAEVEEKPDVLLPYERVQ